MMSAAFAPFFSERNERMGKGDKRTAKGKRTRGTYGKSRPRKTGTRKGKKAAKAGAQAS